MYNFLSPHSIAVVGASRNPKKLGAALVYNIINFGYSGRLYPINPKAKVIQHLKCHKSVLDVEDNIDLAIIVVPAKIVPLILAECGQKGIRNIVVISAGFREQGKEGLKREKEILKLKTKYGFRILGPNCLGFVNTIDRLNATFSANNPVKGNIAFMSQSGAIATSFMDLAERINLGFSYFVSLGNKVDLSELDFLDSWQKDKKLKAIFAYLEHIHFGKVFLKKIKRITREKPIVILKPGETEEAKRAISSHTGSMAGSHQAVQTAFDQNGIILASSIQEFFNLMIVFDNFPVPFGKRIAILTNAGGPAVLATEHLIKAKLKLAKFSRKTVKSLTEHLPSTVNIRDPLDVIGDALSDRYDEALSCLIDDPSVDTILVLLTPQFMTEVVKTAKVIVKHAKQKKKLILTSFIGGVNVDDGIKILQKNKVAHFRYPNQAIQVLEKLAWYEDWKKESQKSQKIFPIFPVSTHKKLKVEKILRNKKNEFLSDQEAFDIAELYEIPIAKTSITTKISEACNIAEFFDFPLVLKISSPKLPHKSDNKAIALNVNNLKELKQQYTQLTKLGKEQIGKSFFHGITVQKMIQGGIETIIGVKKDRNFGHLLMFGSGGIYTEIYKDISFGLIPLTASDCEKLLQRTKVYKILSGARGQKYLFKQLPEILVKVSYLVSDFPQIEELDINPLLVGSDFLKTVDIKIKVK